MKKGIIIPPKRIPLVCLLYHASDSVLLADFNSNYFFPVHTAIPQLRPDVIIFSNSLRKVILIELTCSCEENIESGYGAKIKNKEQTPFVANCRVNDFSKEGLNFPSPVSFLKPTIELVSNAKSFRPDFINNGNTSYAALFLQILSVISTFWNRSP